MKFLPLDGLPQHLIHSSHYSTIAEQIATTLICGQPSCYSSMYKTLSPQAISFGAVSLWLGMEQFSVMLELWPLPYEIVAIPAVNP
ncbi:unnamed protein product [Sphenostylis stenocarpa]|uniref:Uncharacterized protein n=1 Tax=Sphenostylis stenocarpa TaxID=92480 RepID=A0AA86T9X4_9FABA|nr:unnamed protein product [Sphenostylis stenocarpa]